MDFKDRTQTKKGAVGERIIKEFLKENDFITFSPDVEDIPHAFDAIAVSKNKKFMLIAESKAKARMNKYNATGINTINLGEYIFLGEKHKMPVLLFFVDEYLGSVYYGVLDELLKPYSDMVIGYPNTEIVNGVTLFSLDKMKEVRKLTEGEIKELKGLSSRTYEYSVN